VSRKSAPVPADAMTLGSVQPGDSATLESGAVVEVGFRIGASSFVRFPDSPPRCISSLPSTTKVISVIRRERVASAAGEVADPLDSRRKA
jgi:hypothetical protein